MTPRELSSTEELRSLTDDPLVHWAAQGFRDGVRVWADGSAVAVWVADLARRHRFVVSGAPEDVAPVVEELLAGSPHELRPMGDDALIRALCALVPVLSPNRTFGWMHTGWLGGRWAAVPRPETRATRVELAAPGTDDQAIRALLADALPDSLARPGMPGVRRWWVSRDGAALTSCAADAWSTPGVGLLAGVATARAHRGEGLARATVGTALDTMVAEYGSVGLMVDADNAAAIKLYESFGFTYRPVRSAWDSRRNPT